MDDLSFSEVLNKYIEQKGYHHFEGDYGLEKLNTLACDMGYSGHSFKFGSPLEDMLANNPGMIEAMLDWLREFGDDEWRENLMEPLEDES